MPEKVCSLFPAAWLIDRDLNEQAFNPSTAENERVMKVLESSLAERLLK